MAREVDELFGEGEGTPAPRTRTVWALLVSGLLLAVLGLACTTAPGGVLVLIAWMIVEKENDRLENGYLPADARPAVDRLRVATYAGLVVVVLVFLIQIVLFCLGFYETFWENLLVWATDGSGGP